MSSAHTDSRGSTESEGALHGRTSYLVCVGLAVAAILAYANSLSVPFVFDDLPAIVHNDTIRELWPLSVALSPPLDAAGAIGRPVVNLSFAVNYALGGLDVRGYHVVNLGLHVAVGILLFALVRRTLALHCFNGRFSKSALRVAASTALLWIVHPLLTESVTFVTQRNEIIVGLFYLLTLYCFLRSTETSAPSGWQVAAVASCLLGMASKELMVSAPLMVLLYDRTFVTGSFREAWRRRRALYCGLVSTWILLASLIVGNAQRAGTVGFGLGVSSWHYLLTQCEAIVHYLRLSFWPSPLVLDYGTDVKTQLRAVLPQAVILILLTLATLEGVRRRRTWGFVGVWFLAILAPSSSVVPLTTQTMAEHRMYLPLISIVILAVIGLDRITGRASALLCIFIAIALGPATWTRNRDYRSVESLWRDTVAKRPENPRAHLNLGSAVKEAGRLPEAISHYEAAVRLKPNYAEARYNLGSALLLVGQIPEGIARLNEALTLAPGYEDARLNLALALAKTGRPSEALRHFETILPLRPFDAGLRYNVGNALLAMDRPAEAIAHYEAAVRIEPAYINAHYNLGNALLKLDRLSEAEGRFEEVVRLQPDFADARLLLGTLRADRGRHLEAIGQFEQVLRLKPADLEASFLMGRSLEAVGRTAEARSSYERAIRLDPNFEPARQALAALKRVP